MTNQQVVDVLFSMVVLRGMFVVNSANGIRVSG